MLFEKPIEDAAQAACWMDVLKAAWDAGHPDKSCFYFLMADGGHVNIQGAIANRQLILSTMVDFAPNQDDLQWTIIAVGCNAEHPMLCDETGETIDVVER